MIVWHLGISVHPHNTIHLCKHTTVRPSLYFSRVCPLVLLAWCLMEPVPHTGPLRDYAGANHRSCDSSISLQLALTRGARGVCPCWKPAAKVADGAGEVRRMHPNSFCICVAAIQGFIGDFTVLSCYTISKAMWKIVIRHSNGFTGSHVIHIHNNKHTHFTHMHFACWYILTYMHSKDYSNCNEFVPLGQFIS